MARLLTLLALLLALVLPAAAQPVERRGALVPASTPSADAQLVHVGFLSLTLSSIRIEDSSYYLDGFLWFRWQGDLDPSQSYEIINTVQRSELVAVPTWDTPRTLPDGDNYQIVRISGRFYQAFDLSDFPLDSQRLGLLIEDQRYTVEDLVYIADTRNSGISGLLDAANWSITGWTAASFDHDYGTSFGALEENEIYSAVEFAIEIERPARYFIWKLLLPLCVLIVAALASSLLARRADVRVSIPVLTLLASVVLQQSYSSTLPEVGYLVMMDQIFVLAFVIIVAVLIRGVAGAAAERRLEAAGLPLPSVGVVQRRDLLVALGLAVIFAIGTAIIIAMR